MNSTVVAFVGIAIFAWGVIDVGMSWAGTDVYWDWLGIDVGSAYPYTHWIAMAIGGGLGYLSSFIDENKEK